METREAPPAHLLVNIESFSLFEKCQIEKYETKEFAAGEYKWYCESLTDPSNGYVVADKSCVFGAEVFVAKKEAITQCVSSRNVDIPYKRDWIIPNYSKIKQFWESEVFCAGGGKWIFLRYLGYGSVEACFTVRMKDQVFDNVYEKSYKDCLFSANNRIWGCYKFMEIETMNDPKRGFIVNDSCLLQLEISSLRDVAE
ncbi:hypothetical protein MIMGU_mgv11b023521mg [Erythranthe guttata]|uniref:MATH domain-containing protein n=1 Tax=Erythranthe guttata TaxID=4155 RepID=A0A022RKV6_ERYGU|nr:hypothetical protein MIMGU_mgv11b023521mg [Erythranthe guttata]